MEFYDQKGMNLAATGVHIADVSRHKPICARHTTTTGIPATRAVPQGLRPTTLVSKLRLLVVDDCEANADSLVFMLSHAGYETRAIYSVNEGIETAKRFRPDLLICALSTGMQNIEVVTSIREVVPGCKVILFSPRQKQSYAHQRLDEIAADCELINGPLHPEELLSRIKARIG